MSVVYLNGQTLPLEQASIPVLDRGFIFGDGVYEVIPAYGGRLFRLEEHLQRLADSLRLVRMDNPHTLAQWRQILEDLVRQNGDGDQSVYLQVTRGVAPRDHILPDGVTPTVFVMCNPIKPVPRDTLALGVGAISVDDIRWQYCHIKAIALLPNILLRQQAADADAMEAILVRDGLVTEGAASNVFLVKNDTIATPAKSPHLLPGITRDLVVELARDNGFACEERNIRREELAAADEIWLTSSTKEILPVTRLDGKDLANGAPGPIWKKMIDIYQAYKQQLQNRDQ